MKKWLIIFVIIVISLIFLQNSPNKVIRLHSEDVVLAFGDSLTQGVGVAKMHSYPTKLSEALGITVINSGVSGQTSTQGLKRLQKELDQHQPQLVVLCLGGNDILRKHSMIKLKQNMATMIEIIQSQNIQVMLIGVPEPGLFLDVMPLYEALSEQYDLVSDHQILAELLNDNQYKSDMVHLNQAGYLKLAEAVMNKIEVY